MRTKAAKTQPEPQQAVPEIREPNDEDVQRMIAIAAYYRAEKRGFSPGREEEDWREAEMEIRSRVRALQARI